MEYKKFELENGLKVIVHEDHSVNVAVVNILYNVGSKDEDENRTGFAHLFEHLMFGGSKNIPSFDEPLQRVGGENNAFTSEDLTNYYCTVPSNNIETAFWLESDRMLSLSFDPEVLEVQRSVVIEEFKQRYLNQPYGDAWLSLKDLAYTKHPYRWATIGKEIKHIEDATMDDVKAFFQKFYVPNNAIMVVAGNVDLEQVKSLSEKWFAPIPSGENYERQLPKEPEQKAARFEEIASDVPLNAIYKAYHICDRLSPNYHCVDLLSDILGRGTSSRFYKKLVQDKSLMSSVSCYISGSHDEGLLVITGKLKEGVAYDEVEHSIDEVLEDVKQNGVGQNELDKVVMKATSSHIFSEVELLNRAINLAIFTQLGDTDLVNKELPKIQSVTLKQIKSQANSFLRSENCSTIHYKCNR